MSSEPNKPIEEVFADRLKFEHDVISHRMTWLMTLNSFLTGAAAVLAANGDKFAASYGLAGGMLAVSLLGALSNASCLFSNYWAARAIAQAADILPLAWHKLDPAELAERRLRMRLYGRDPRDFLESSSPPSQILHPWLFLPTIFLLFFAALPTFSGSLNDKDIDIPVAWALPVLCVALSPFVILPVLDLRHRRRYDKPQDQTP